MPSGRGGSSEESIYPSGPVKFTMQLGTAEKRAGEVCFAVDYFNLSLSRTQGNPCCVQLMGEITGIRSRHSRNKAQEELC